tara:strand:- start:5747 stop:8026 length:2280 start_codon:yes stop_codon:yes gene_type:complete
MATKNKRAEEIHNLFLRLNGQNRQSWEAANQKGHDYFLDNQMSAEEEKALSDQGMPTFTINRIIPIVEMLVFYATANDPRWQAVGVEGSDSTMAAVHNDIADYIWHRSHGKSIMHQVVQDACTKGLGYMQVYVDPNDDQGLGEVKLRCLEPFDVFVDPQSRDPLFRDAGFIMIQKILPRQQLINIIPEAENKIKKANSQYPNHMSLTEKAASNDFQYKDINENFSPLGEDELMIDYYELYEKVSLEYYNVTYRIEPSDEEIAVMGREADQALVAQRKELEVSLKEQILQIQQQAEAQQIIPERAELEIAKAQQTMEQQLEAAKEQINQEMMEKASETVNKIFTKEEFNILMKGELKNKIISQDKFFESKIKLTLCIGDQLIYEQFLPGTDYPIVPFNYKWTGTPYPLSAVSPLVGKQMELNKAHQLMIHNASLGSSLRWIYQDGSVDTDYWEKFASAPGALLPVNNGYEYPKEVQPAQLSSAFVNMIQMGKGDMEYLAGIYSSQQGDMQAQHDTYKGLLANDEYGTRRVKQWVEGYIKMALEHLGNVVKDYAQATYQIQKVFRIVQPNALQDEKQTEINVPMYNDFGEQIGLFNDYANARFDVRIIAGNSLPVNRWAYLGELKEMLQLGVVDDLAVLAETDIKNKEKIAERKSLYSQLQGQIADLEEQLKNQTGAVETLERQLVQAGIKDKVRQVEHDMRKKLTDTSARLRGDAAVNKANQDAYNRQLKEANKNHEKELLQQRKTQMQNKPLENSEENS